MKIGAERNKVILLIVVSSIAVYSVYTQLFAPESQSVPPRAGRTASSSAAPRTALARRATPQAVRVRGGSFRPSFPSAGAVENLDPMNIDPTLRVDLLERVRAVSFDGVSRNLFQFGVRKKKKPEVKPPSAEQLAAVRKRMQAAAQANTVAAGTSGPAKRKAPPIKLKYYGFANEPGNPRRRAFLLDGEEVLIGAEGDIFKKRYKIIKIGASSIVVEDLQFSDQQNLKLEDI